MISSAVTLVCAACAGPLDGDGQPELAVGAEFNGGREGGAWLLFLGAPESWRAGDA